MVWRATRSSQVRSAEERLCVVARPDSQSGPKMIGQSDRCVAELLPDSIRLSGHLVISVCTDADRQATFRRLSTERLRRAVIVHRPSDHNRLVIALKHIVELLPERS